MLENERGRALPLHPASFKKLDQTSVTGTAELRVILGTDHSANDLSSTKTKTCFLALCATFLLACEKKLKMTTVIIVRKFLEVLEPSFKKVLTSLVTHR